MAWDPVGAAVQLAKVTNDVAWGLYYFFDRVKSAPSTARKFGLPVLLLWKPLSALKVDD
jgi:hypothetical protein